MSLDMQGGVYSPVIYLGDHTPTMSIMYHIYGLGSCPPIVAPGVSSGKRLGLSIPDRGGGCPLWQFSIGGWKYVHVITDTLQDVTMQIVR